MIYATSTPINAPKKYNTIKTDAPNYLLAILSHYSSKSDGSCLMCLPCPYSSSARAAAAEFLDPPSRISAGRRLSTNEDRAAELARRWGATPEAAPGSPSLYLARGLFCSSTTAVAVSLLARTCRGSVSAAKNQPIEFATSSRSRALLNRSQRSSSPVCHPWPPAFWKFPAKSWSRPAIHDDLVRLPSWTILHGLLKIVTFLQDLLQNPGHSFLTPCVEIHCEFCPSVSLSFFFSICLWKQRFNSIYSNLIDSSCAGFPMALAHISDLSYLVITLFSL